jgi:hypothetical protein
MQKAYLRSTIQPALLFELRPVSCVCSVTVFIHSQCTHKVEANEKRKILPFCCGFYPAQERQSDMYVQTHGHRMDGFYSLEGLEEGETVTAAAMCHTPPFLMSGRLSTTS